MNAEYDFTGIEAAAQRYWNENRSFRAVEDPAREKFYCLSMFPYPSGRLHMGHVRNYTIGDVVSRYQRMQGRNVLQPMGWDAFGLPAENAAMKNAVPPASWTWDNIDHMRGQLQALGFAIDWERELATCQPDYYHWNQWLFLRMLEQGLAYKQTGVVNWDPVDRTVLANEQVIEGRGWRTGALVEKREIPMYYLAITRYADQLLEDLEELPGWPDRVKAMQANWIGRSYGVRFAFPYELDGKQEKLWVYTTRADTIMGVTFCVVAAEHKLAEYAAKDNPELAAFVDECKRGTVMEADLATMEKKGLPTGLNVLHPLTGEPIPLWVGNYVLMGYGDGAVMAVPAHDERDFQFAKEYELPIRQVIQVPGEEFDNVVWQEWYADKERGHCVNSGKYDGLDVKSAVDAIASDFEALELGGKQVQYRLRDWGVSRQRYWGCPIPIVHCPKCGDVPVPDDQLPVVLPEECVPDGSGNPLNKLKAFVETACPTCGGDAKRETDTMDTFVDSSWYYTRYCCADSTESMVDPRADYWMPVDQYIGGIEHAILHLLYSRFWSKVMRDMGLVKFDEPFSNLLTQGMVLNHVFSRRNDQGGVDYFAPDEVELEFDEGGRVTGASGGEDGQPVEYEGISTMSKSKRNGIDPQALIDRYGADTARLFMMFTAPPEQSLEWNDDAVAGAHRFLRRWWNLVQRYKEALTASRLPSPQELQDAGAKTLRGSTHSMLEKANRDYKRFQYNTVIAACMELVNVLDKFAPEGHPERLSAMREALGVLNRVLAPIAPHIAHTLWRELEEAGDVIDAAWPEVDPTALVRDTIKLVVQVNGKLRGEIEVPADAGREHIEERALADEKVQRHTAGKTVRKVIVVPGKLINIVV